MRKHFWIDCNTIMDTIYESENNNSLTIFSQIVIWLHCLLCPRCAGEIRNLRQLKDIMKTDFFPPSPGVEEVLMERLLDEAVTEDNIDAPAGFSFRGWVIIGFFVLLSLSTSFFGIDFIQIAASEGLSFLLPMGLTIGLVLTCYGALFIGSHLNELSTRFRLH